MNKTFAMLPNELSLVARAKAEPAAFAAIYDHYFSRVYNYIRYRVGDADITDDLTASTFEAILANLEHFQPERGSFATWTFTIARNIVNDHFRQQKFRNWFSLDILRNKASSEPEPEEVFVKNEMHDRLLAAMAHLGSRDQDLIALKFGAGLSSFQISKLTSLNQNNINVSVYRAVRRLRNLLKDKEEEEKYHEPERMG